MTTRENGRAFLWLLLAMAIVIAAPSAAQERRVKPLTAQDHAEIQQLYARYHWATDAGDSKMWSDTFSVDGEYSNDGPTPHTKGRDNLLKRGVSTVRSGRPRGLRFTTNIRIEPTPEGARGGSYMLNVTPGGPGKPTTVMAAVYEDVLVKTPEGWRFKSRRTYLKDPGMAPETILHAEAAAK